MLDTGLLFSIALMVVVPATWARRTQQSFSGERLLDVVVGPLLVGVLIGRASTLLFDDPGSLRSLRDFSIIRSGVEFWPGVVAGLVTMAVAARRRRVPGMTLLAAVTPFALVAYGVYEAACVLREGCYGPVSAVGLRPAGLQTTMFPLGWVLAATVISAAALLDHVDRKPAAKLIIGIAVVAVARSVVSIWMPKIGDGMTRPHQWSIAVAALALAALATMGWRARAAVGVPCSDDGGGRTRASG